MSTQAEINSNPYQYILYYVNQNDPTTVYQTDCSDICSLFYDGSDNLQVTGWLLEFDPPTMPTDLEAYTLSDVLDFYNNFYVIPSEIAANEPYMISTVDLENVRADNSMKGFVIYDTTVQATKYWSGIDWYTTASRYGGTGSTGPTGPMGQIGVTGATGMIGQTGATGASFPNPALVDLDMDTHNLLNVGTLYQSLPSCIGIWTSASTAISFTANTPKVVSLASFSQSVNPNSDFSYDSSTGEVTYTGASTRYFKVTVNFSCTALAVASTQTNYISLNGSTTIGAQRSVNSYLLLGQANIDSYSLSDIIQLATNDTVQLGSQLSTTNNVTFSNISYSISQL